MKNSNHLGSFILLAIAFIPISTYSWEIANRRPIPFFLYDKDGDNLISKKEFSETRSERWPKKETSMLNEINTSSLIVFDKNNDGQLTQRELASGQQIQKIVPQLCFPPTPRGPFGPKSTKTNDGHDF